MKDLHKAHDNGTLANPGTEFNNWLTTNFTTIKHTTDTTKTPQPHPPSNQLKIYRQKGHEIYTQMLAAVSNKQQAKDTAIPNLSAWDLTITPVDSYDQNTKLDFHIIDPHSGREDDMARYFRVYEYYLRADRFFFYKNHMGPKAGIMIAVNNQGIDDNGKRAPARWSDVVWKAWTDECGADRLPTTNLRFVIQEIIINFTTQEILDEVTGRRDGDGDGGGDGGGQVVGGPAGEDAIVYEFTPRDEDFYALLSSPNVIGVARVVMGYPVALGFKVVSRIRALRQPESLFQCWDVIVDLEPYAQPGLG